MDEYFTIRAIGRFWAPVESVQPSFEFTLARILSFSLPNCFLLPNDQCTLVRTSKAYLDMLSKSISLTSARSSVVLLPPSQTSSRNYVNRSHASRSRLPKAVNEPVLNYMKVLLHEHLPSFLHGHSSTRTLIATFQLCFIFPIAFS